MEKTVSNDTWKLMFGREPNIHLKKLVLDDVKNTGIDIREAVSKYRLPKIAVLDEGKFYCDEFKERLTPAEWVERNPLGKYARIVIITPK